MLFRSPTQRMPTSFESAYIFYRDNFQKLLKYENHIRIFDTHLQQKTCPGNLVWKFFPEPFLPADEEYVDAYNTLISDFQINVMKLSGDFCKKRITNITDELSKMTEHFSNITDISSRVELIKKEVSNTLKQKMDNKFNAILSLKPQFYNVKQNNTHKPNEISPEFVSNNNNNNRSRIHNRNHSPNHSNFNNNRSQSRSRFNQNPHSSRSSNNRDRSSSRNNAYHSQQQRNRQNVNFRNQSLSRNNY